MYRANCPGGPLDRMIVTLVQNREDLLVVVRNIIVSKKEIST
jgi:hypothetical protein